MEWSKVSDASGHTAYEIYAKPLLKSQLDNREYRYIRLPNKLEALLISDAEADKTAAALDVCIGHLTDPVSSTTYSFPIILT